MAGLGSNIEAAPGAISAAQQFGAIAYLRWRLFVNGFRRKGGAGELFARIITYPVAAIFVIGPAVGAGLGGWACFTYDKPEAVAFIFWGITLLQIFVSINISAPGLSFDPEALIRFPVSFSRFLVVRLFLGLLSASTIIGTVSLLATAAGVTAAKPALWPIAFAAAILLAITNMLFIRMIFAWIDRWLSTRRARELLTGFIILVSIGFQYVNVTFNSAFNRHGDHAAQRRKMEAAMRLYHSSHAFLAHFPPGLAGSAMLTYAHGALLPALAGLLELCLFGALFLAVFAWRMHREYRGENLSGSGGTVSGDAGLDRAAGTSRATGAAGLNSFPSAAPVAEPTASSYGLSPVLQACFYKEWIYVRRNTTQIYQMFAPVAMVFIFAGRMGVQSGRSEWTFPSAIAYSTLGIAVLAYNAFGLDAEGIQFYCLAPVPMHTVLLAKNLFSFALAAFEFALVYGVLCIVAGPPPALAVLATLCWLVCAVLANVTIGNMRSITAPKKMDPSKLSRKQTSQLSALISVGMSLGLAAIGAGVLFLGSFLNLPWLPVPILLALAAGAFALYTAGLNRLDDLAYHNRETMLEELCKAS